METASQDLLKEHKAIEIALNVLEKMSDGIKGNKGIDIKDIKDIIDFLKVFADKCHHGKEEDFLFPALEEAGVQNQNGPIGVMLAEHRQGREYIKQMKESIENTTIDNGAFVSAASSYVTLLRNHIKKENTILFPMGDAKLSASKQKDLLNNFEILEEEIIGAGVHEKLHALLEKFKKKYLT